MTETDGLLADRRADDALRTFDGAADGDPAAAPPAVLRIAGTAVPRQVGPYFTSDPADPVELHRYAQAAGLAVLGDTARRHWARLGSDSGYEICADPDGVVRAVLLDWDEPLRFVNTTPEAFADGLRALDEALAGFAAAKDGAEATTAFRRLKERLAQADPQALADPESWWPLVLDDIRHTSGTEWYAAVEYRDASGKLTIVTASGGICLHPEERLWAELHAAGVEPEQVTRIHTDLEVCFMPGHYCSMWMAQLFPDAELTHGIPYGETAESRAEGLRLLRERTARRSRD